MRTFRVKQWLAALLTGASLTLASIGAQADDPFKVGFIYVGPVGDNGWSYQHDLGRQAVEKNLGDKVKTTYIESVPEGADAERAITNLVKDGNKLIFTTSFGYMNPTAKVAKKYPDVTFMHATGYKQDKNLGTYIAKSFEGRYVAGFLAAKMTKSNTIGYIASFPIPEVIRDINSVQLAVNRYNPKAKLKIVWVNTWFDPGKEADAANALMDQGADVIFQHTDSPAAMQAAERRGGVYGVGQDSDMSRFGEKAHLVSVVQNWEKYYTDVTKSVMEGTWKSGDFWGGMAEGVVTADNFNKSVPEDIKAEATKLVNDIKGGYNPFVGPIKNQKGEVIVPEGSTMSIADLAKMDWYVEGIEGDIPK
jgi:simple sugar transport system substrate-binding protein